MIAKWFGALLILGGASAAGFGASLHVKRTYAQLHQLRRALELMKCELCYTMTKLPQLMQVVADATQGGISRLFSRISEKLRECSSAPTEELVQQAICETPSLSLPPEILSGLHELGATLGRYDLDGQLRLLELLLTQIAQLADTADAERRARCRSYEVLGICTGLALIILMV